MSECCDICEEASSERLYWLEAMLLVGADNNGEKPRVAGSTETIRIRNYL